MKRKKLMQIAVATCSAIFSSTNYVSAQATSAGNSNSPIGSNEYLGWKISTGLDLDILNEDSKPIKFYTNAGQGSLNNLRMIIYDASERSNSGYVGIGNFDLSGTSPQSNLHILTNEGNTWLQFTSVLTQHSATDGFRLGIPDKAKDVIFHQQEEASMIFKVLSTDRLNIAPSGAVTMSSLAGSGTRYLVANSSGTISPTGSIPWLTSGNSISPGDFIGTTNTEDFIIRTSNTNRMWVNKSTGFVGIGVNADIPLSTLQINAGLAKICLGNGGVQANAYFTGYLGFNLNRESNGSWKTENDGSSNGGSGIICDAGGNLNFVAIGKTEPSPANTNQTFSTDADILARSSMRIDAKGRLHICENSANNTTQDAMYIGDKLTIHKGITPNSTSAFASNFIWDDDNNVARRRVSNDNCMMMAFNGTLGDITFTTADNNGNAGDVITWKECLKIKNNGQVGIGAGSYNGSYGACSLAVAGMIGANELKIIAVGAPFPDYVFASNYNLRKLEDVESFISQNKHLPEMPSACEVENNNGYEVGKMQLALLKKVEEMTLYVIELNKRIDALETENSNMKKLLK